jgi:hypothetical protein
MNVMELLPQRRHLLRLLVAVVLGLLLLALPSAQATAFGSAIRITTNTGASRSPSVAASGSHVYVAWADDTPVDGSGSNPEIWLRVSSDNGASFGSAIRISRNVYGSYIPSVAAYGSYVYVAWQDSTPVPGSGSWPEIWLRVSSNYGASFGSATRISYNTYASQSPRVAAYGNSVYVVWEDYTPVSGSGSQTEIWMRTSSNNGATFGSPTRISYNTYASNVPSIAASGSYVYVAWSDGTPVEGSGATYEVWMRTSSDNGGSFGAPIRMTRNTGDSYLPFVAANGSYVYVAWDDFTSVSGSGSVPEVWMRVSSNNGASFGSPIRITTNTGNSVNPSVAASGNYVYVAWQDNTPVSGSGSAYEIWMRVSSNYGASFGSAIRITANTGDSDFASVAATENHAYVAWEDWTSVSGSGTAPEIWLKIGS